MFVNALWRQPKGSGQDGFRPGDPIDVAGDIYEQRGTAAGTTQQTGVPATYKLRTVDAEGTVRGPFGPFTADSDGAVTETSSGRRDHRRINPDESTDFRELVRNELVDAATPRPAPPSRPGATACGRPNR